MHCEQKVSRRLVRKRYVQPLPVEAGALAPLLKRPVDSATRASFHLFDASKMAGTEAKSGVSRGLRTFSGAQQLQPDLILAEQTHCNQGGAARSCADQVRERLHSWQHQPK